MTEEYLTLKALCGRIPYQPQTIRNLMSKGVLVMGVHYLKPSGRLIFKWSAMQAWLEAPQVIPAEKGRGVRPRRSPSAAEPGPRSLEARAALGDPGALAEPAVSSPSWPSGELSPRQTVPAGLEADGSDESSAVNRGSGGPR